MNTHYKKWITNVSCSPQVASCLILGLDPTKYAKRLDDFGRTQNKVVKKAREICNILCNGDIWPGNDQNIFTHINTALENRIEVVDVLLIEIAEYYAYFVDTDKDNFIKKYQYLARKLPLQTDQTKKHEQKTSISEKECPQVLQMILGMAMHAYGYTPGASKNSATGANKGSIHAALQSFGLNVNEDTIRKYLNEAVEMFPNAVPSSPISKPNSVKS